ncbi:MAG TPA: hypothetical protein VGJ34_03395 [Gaiellaceae bacterium]
MRVGEKDTSEQAAIVARYADLFSRDQFDELRDSGDERVYRLQEACLGGIVVGELAERMDELENAILAERVEFRGEALPLRSAQAMLAVLDDYRGREELGTLAADASARFNDERLELLRAGEAIDVELSGVTDPVARNAERKGIDLHDLAGALRGAAREQEGRWGELRERWADRILGEEREAEPSSHHVAYLRRMSPLASLYAKERAVPVCMESLRRLGFDLAADGHIHLDLDDRPQKSPRACVIASDPPTVVHLITRAQGGLHDYQSFLHEAGHALHYAGCDPKLPYTFRRLSRDHALTEIYSFLVESVSREAGWQGEHFDLDPDEADERAEATRFLDVFLFRRYAAKLDYELEVWADFAHAPDYAPTYAENLRATTGFRYRSDGYLADMDDGFYSADYLRAWIRTAQLRAHLRETIGPDWWERPETGEFLRSLFREGTRPSSEEVAARIGFEPLDTRPLVQETVEAS